MSETQMTKLADDEPRFAANLVALAALFVSAWPMMRDVGR